MRPWGLDKWAQQDQQQERSCDTWGRLALGPFRNAPRSEGAGADDATSVCEAAGGAGSSRHPLSIHPTGLSELMDGDPCPQQDCLWLPLWHTGTKLHESRDRELLPLQQPTPHWSTLAL